VTIAAGLFDALQRQMGDELVPRGDGPSEVEREDHLSDVGEIERDPAPLDHSTNEITPFDVEGPRSG
jgi:hypothetical protein